MDAPLGTGTQCLSDDTIAAFVDARLSASERAAVVMHLAHCARCRELASSVALTVPAPPTKVLAFRRPWFAGGALAAAAAVIAFAVALWPHAGGYPTPELKGLVDAMGSTRVVEPRLAGGFAYGPLQAITRGPSSQSLETQVSFARIEKASTDRPSRTTRRALATSLLLQRRNDEAIAVSEELTREDPGDAGGWSDLSAARLARGSGDDAAAALNAADRALAIDPRLPEALFNRALALERLGRGVDARVAWGRYLQRDGTSGWADEARRHAASVPGSAGS